MKYIALCFDDGRCFAIKAEEARAAFLREAYASNFVGEFANYKLAMAAIMAALDKRGAGGGGR